MKSSADLLAFIVSKRKVLYIEDHTPKPLANYELKLFQKAQERVKLLHEKLEEVSNELATTLINLKRKVPSRIGEDQQSRIEKENKRKVKKLKEKRLQQSRAYLLERCLMQGKRTTVFTSIATINSEFTGKLIRRLHLDPLLGLLEKGVFDENITRTLHAAVAGLNEESTEDSRSLEDGQESVKEGVQDATKEALGGRGGGLGDEAVTLKIIIFFFLLPP